jgi:hypothetical protein
MTLVGRCNAELSHIGPDSGGRTIDVNESGAESVRHQAARPHEGSGARAYG